MRTLDQNDDYSNPDDDTPAPPLAEQRAELARMRAAYEEKSKYGDDWQNEHGRKQLAEARARELEAAAQGGIDECESLPLVQRVAESLDTTPRDERGPDWYEARERVRQRQEKLAAERRALRLPKVPMALRALVVRRVAARAPRVRTRTRPQPTARGDDVPPEPAPRPVVVGGRSRIDAIADLLVGALARGGSR